MVSFTKAKNQESWLTWSGAVGGREYVFGDFRGKHNLGRKEHTARKLFINLPILY